MIHEQRDSGRNDPVSNHAIDVTHSVNSFSCGEEKREHVHESSRVCLDPSYRPGPSEERRAVHVMDEPRIATLTWRWTSEWRDDLHVVSCLDKPTCFGPYKVPRGIFCMRGIRRRDDEDFQR